jgi:putative addiction module killer protein
MAGLRRTGEFDAWLKGVRDTRAKAKILVRVERLGSGNPGDVAPVGDGISEMRIHYGPGYRIYFKRIGEDTVILCAGDKDSQKGDIDTAKLLAKEVED